MASEGERVGAYMISNSEPKLLAVCETELLARHQSTLLQKEGSGCRALLQNHKKDTALHLACQKSHNAIIKLLVWHDASINVVNVDGKTCAMVVPLNHPQRKAQIRFIQSCPKEVKAEKETARTFSAEIAREFSQCVRNLDYELNRKIWRKLHRKAYERRRQRRLIPTRLTASHRRTGDPSDQATGSGPEAPSGARSCPAVRRR